jgi:hypothetical protein
MGPWCKRGPYCEAVLAMIVGRSQGRSGQVIYRSEATVADQVSGPRPDAETPLRSVVVAYVTGDDAHVEVRRAAQEHALAHGCAIILYVADAASWWSEPMPNQWGSEGEGDRFGSRLGPEDLEALGRSDVRAQVIEGRESHVSAFAWLPKDHGAGALAQYASEQVAHLIFVPSELESIDELSSLVAGATASEELGSLAIEVRAVGSKAESVDQGA